METVKLQQAHPRRRHRHPHDAHRRVRDYRWRSRDRAAPPLHAPDGGMWRNVASVVEHVSTEDARRRAARAGRARARLRHRCHAPRHAHGHRDAAAVPAAVRRPGDRVPAAGLLHPPERAAPRRARRRRAGLHGADGEARRAGWPLLDNIITQTLGEIEPEDKDRRFREMFATLRPGLTHFLVHPAKGGEELDAMTPDRLREAREGVRALPRARPPRVRREPRHQAHRLPRDPRPAAGGISLSAVSYQRSASDNRTPRTDNLDLMLRRLILALSRSRLAEHLATNVPGFRHLARRFVAGNTQARCHRRRPSPERAGLRCDGLVPRRSRHVRGRGARRGRGVHVVHRRRQGAGPPQPSLDQAHGAGPRLRPRARGAHARWRARARGRGRHVRAHRHGGLALHARRRSRSSATPAPRTTTSASSCRRTCAGAQVDIEALARRGRAGTSRQGRVSRAGKRRLPVEAGGRRQLRAPRRCLSRRDGAGRLARRRHARRPHGPRRDRVGEGA